MPGPGLISERSQTAGEKIHCEAFGWVRTGLGLEWPQHRPVAAIGTDRQLDLAHLVAGVAQLAQVFELRMTFRHIFKGLSLGAQLTFLG